MAQPPYQTRVKAVARFKRLMRWMVVLAFAMIGLALLSFKLTGIAITPAMFVATIAGVGFSMLIGTGLMGLIFLSANSGHDDEAADHKVDHSGYEG